jgi:hypothetical protein
VLSGHQYMQCIVMITPYSCYGSPVRRASAVAVVAALRASASGGTQSLQKGAAVQDSPQLAVYAEQQQQPIPLPSIGGSSSGDSGVSTNMSSTDRVHDSNCMRSASLASAGGVSSSADGSLAGGRSQMAGGGDGSATAGFAKGSPQQQCIAGSPSHSSLTQDCLTLHDCQHAADLQGKPAGSGLPSVVPDGRWRFTARVEGTGAVAEAVPSASRGSRIAAPMPAANSVDVQSWGSSSLPMGLPIMSMAACQGLLVVGCAEPLLQILRTVVSESMCKTERAGKQQHVCHARICQNMHAVVPAVEVLHHRPESWLSNIPVVPNDPTLHLRTLGV